MFGITGKGAEWYRIDRFQRPYHNAKAREEFRPWRISDRTGIKSTCELVQEKALCSSQTPAHNAPSPQHGSRTWTSEFLRRQRLHLDKEVCVDTGPMS